VYGIRDAEPGVSPWTGAAKILWIAKRGVRPLTIAGYQLPSMAQLNWLNGGGELDWNPGESDYGGWGAQPSVVQAARSGCFRFVITGTNIRETVTMRL
jgi:hypothetical protein